MRRSEGPFDPAIEYHSYDESITNQSLHDSESTAAKPNPVTKNLRRLGILGRPLPYVFRLAVDSCCTTAGSRWSKNWLCFVSKVATVSISSAVSSKSKMLKFSA